MSGDVLADAARAPAAIRMLSANSIMPRVGVSDVKRPFFLNMVRRMLVKQGAAGSQTGARNVFGAAIGISQCLISKQSNHGVALS